MSQNTKLPPVTALLLGRLLGAPRGLPLATLRRDLSTVAKSAYEKSSWEQTLNDACDHAKHNELVVERGASTWLVTPAGTRQALALLRWGERPARCTWPRVQQRLAEVIACDAALVKRPDAKRAAGSAPSLVAGVLRETMGLKVPASASTTQLADSLLWRALGVASAQPATLARLRAHVLANELGSPLPLPKAILTLAAKKIGASRADPNVLVQTILQRFLRPADDAPSTSPSPARWAAPADFADRVRDAARHTAKAGRFGATKVFINHVFRSYCHRYGANRALDYGTFQKALVEAYRNNHLMLSYADLVEAMNPSDVAESCTFDSRQPLHFVCL